MCDAAKEAYDKTVVGEIGLMRPDTDKGETVEGFQLAARAADIMQNDGLIQIRTVHHESTSGRHLVDAIRFLKMR